MNATIPKFAESAKSTIAHFPAQAFNSGLALQAIRNFDLTTSQIAVFAILLSHANKQGEAWPTQGTLAKECGISCRKVVRKALTELERLGLIGRVSSRYKVVKWRITAQHFRLGCHAPTVGVSCPIEVVQEDTEKKDAEKSAVSIPQEDYPPKAAIAAIPNIDEPAVLRYAEHIAAEYPHYAKGANIRKQAIRLARLPRADQSDCVDMALAKNYLTLPIEWFERKQQSKARPAAANPGAANAFAAVLEALRKGTPDALDARTLAAVRATFGDWYSLGRLNEYALSSKRGEYLRNWADSADRKPEAAAKPDPEAQRERERRAKAINAEHNRRRYG